MASALTGIGPVAEALNLTATSFADLGKLRATIAAKKADIQARAQAEVEKNRRAGEDRKSREDIAASNRQSRENIAANRLAAASKSKGQARAFIPETLTPQLAQQLGIEYADNVNLMFDPSNGDWAKHIDGTPVLSPKKTGEAEVRSALDVALAELRRLQLERGAELEEQKAQADFLRDGKTILAKNALAQPERVQSAIELMFKVEANGAFKDPEARAALMDAWLQGKSAWPFPTSWKERSDAKGGGAVARAQTLFSGPDYTVLDFGDQVEGASQYLGLLTPGSSTADRQAPTSNDVIGHLPDGREVSERALREAYKNPQNANFGSFEEYKNWLFQKHNIQPVAKVPSISSEKE